MNINSATIASTLPVRKPRYDWLFRYKLYHLPFWFAYHCMWWILGSANISETAKDIFFSPYSIKLWFYVIFQAIGVYFNLYYLIPRVLEKDRFVSYIVLVVATIIATGMLIVPGYYLSAWVSGKNVHELYGGMCYFELFVKNALPSTVASMTLGMSIKLTKKWIETRQRQQMLEKEKLETELKFLKSQINPHFLFNTINSIFVLIHKSPMMASESLAKFSDLLRYQLYECNEQQIPLDQELSYLENFIELQKLRQDHGNIQLMLKIEQPYNPTLAIAPFVLIPFIENAFKHVSRRKDDTNWINMDLRFDHQHLYFTISNSISEHYHGTRELIPHSGIGLKNVKRRLDLMYPGQYNLDIHQDDTQFQVTLQLVLHERSLLEPTAAVMR